MSLPRRTILFLISWVIAILLLWAGSAGLIVYLIEDWPSRGQFGDLFGAVNSLFAGIAFAGVVIALLLQYRETTKSHDWNRRKAAHDVAFETCQGKFSQRRRVLEKKVKIYDPDQQFTTVTLTEEELRDLDENLNFLENVCMTIKNNVVDEEIIFQSFGGLLVAYERWAKLYIEDTQKLHPHIWCEMQPYAERWAVRHTELRRKIAAALLSAGHDPL